MTPQSTRWGRQRLRAVDHDQTKTKLLTPNSTSTCMLRRVIAHKYSTVRVNNHVWIGGCPPSDDPVKTKSDDNVTRRRTAARHVIFFRALFRPASFVSSLADCLDGEDSESSRGRDEPWRLSQGTRAVRSRSRGESRKNVQPSEERKKKERITPRTTRGVPAFFFWIFFPSVARLTQLNQHTRRQRHGTRHRSQG